MSRVGPKANAGVSSGEKGRGAMAGRPAVNLPPSLRKYSLMTRERAFSSASGSPRLRVARGATQGKDHAPVSPAAKSEPLQMRMGRRTSRWGTRTRSRGNECRKKRLFAVFITGILY